MRQFSINQIRIHIIGKKDYYFMITEHYIFNNSDYYSIRWLSNDYKPNRQKSCSAYWLHQYSKECIDDAC